MPLRVAINSGEHHQPICPRRASDTIHLRARVSSNLIITSQITGVFCGAGASYNHTVSYWCVIVIMDSAHLNKTPPLTSW